MKLFRHLGLMIAVLWCAAMLFVPLADAADAGHGTNQGNNQGMNRPGSTGTRLCRRSRPDRQIHRAVIR